MCGIFAYIGSNPECLKFLIDGLKRLEYRGYDSAGVCVHDGSSSLFREKATGKVSILEQKCGNATALKGSLGIAHTRWATHGKPNDLNAHPHFSTGNDIAVVHNGIIENYSSLKKELTRKGYIFRSETDTECLAHLVDDLRKQFPSSSLTQVIASALELCVGTFGCVFLFADEPDKMIGARRGSPLIMGLNESNPDAKEYFLASDGAAVVAHTRDVVYINDGEIVEISKTGYEILDMRRLARKMRKEAGQNVSNIYYSNSSTKESGTPRANQRPLSDPGVFNPVVQLELELEEIQKGGFDHFMLKEIHDQGNSLKQCISGRCVCKDGEGDRVLNFDFFNANDLEAEMEKSKCTFSINIAGLGDQVSDFLSSVDDADVTPPGGVRSLQMPRGNTIADDILNTQRLVFLACGTSWHSALIGEYYFEQIAKIPCEVEYASEFRYRKPLIREGDVVFGISQSGETADTLEALRLAKAYGARTFGIVNVVGSTIARETDSGMYIRAGPEIGVASTKAFTGQVLSLLLLALHLGKRNQSLMEEDFTAICKEIYQLPALITKVIGETTEQITHAAARLMMAQNFLFLGRGLNFPVALEGALKLKEISYIHAEGYPAAEMKHGPISLIDRFMPVVFIAPNNDPVYDKIKSNIEEVHARDGCLIIVTNHGNKDFEKMAKHTIFVPAVSQYIQPLVTVLPMQLLAYHIAKERGCEIDQPRNLAKSVTVE